MMSVKDDNTAVAEKDSKDFKLLLGVQYYSLATGSVKENVLPSFTTL